jgi:hypothetical protein
LGKDTDGVLSEALVEICINNKEYKFTTLRERMMNEGKRRRAKGKE